MIKHREALQEVLDNQGYGWELIDISVDPVYMSRDYDEAPLRVLERMK